MRSTSFRSWQILGVWMWTGGSVDVILSSYTPHHQFSRKPGIIAFAARFSLKILATAFSNT
jgi:hypothetical protein